MFYGFSWFHIGFYPSWMPETRSETLKTCAALAWWCWLMMIRILTSWWWCWYLQTDLSSRWLDVRRLLAAEAWLSGPGGELPATPDTSTSYPPSFKSDGELQRCKDVVACTCMYLHVRKYIEYNTCSEMWCDGETEKSPIVQTYYFFIGIGVICKYLVPRLLVFNTQYFLYFNHWYEEKHEDFYFYVCSCNNRFFFVVQLMSFVYSKVSLLFFLKLM